MKLVVLIMITVLASNASANFDFKLVQPADNYVTEKLAWDNEERADAISDWTLYALLVWPIVEGLNGPDSVKKLGSLAAAHYMSSSLTHWTKTRANRVRPNGRGEESFFSGHTSAAFTSASFICATENSDKCVVGLGLATATGYLRIGARKHYMTDVLVGAIVGASFGYPVPVWAFGF